MSASRWYPEKGEHQSAPIRRGFVHLCFLFCSWEGHSGHNRPLRRGPAAPNLHACPPVTYSFLTIFAEDRLPATMHRLTARLLLILMLSGTIAPAALAISAPSPHACCKRKPLHNHGGPSSEFRASDCGNHDCCRPLTVSQRAQPRPPISGCVSQPSATLLQQMNPSCRIIDFSDSRSARAPPTLSIA
jgi:hypothetical protein